MYFVPGLRLGSHSTGLNPLKPLMKCFWKIDLLTLNYTIRPVLFAKLPLATMLLSKEILVKLIFKNYHILSLVGIAF